jgi:hypothetical protein
MIWKRRLQLYAHLEGWTEFKTHALEPFGNAALFVPAEIKVDDDDGEER